MPAASARKISMTTASPKMKSLAPGFSEKTPLVFLVFVYLLTSIPLILVDFPKVYSIDLPGPDDYMRLQQVRDWLGGQAWHDVNQHRFVTDAGGDMHFSRYPDILIAGLFLLFRPFMSEHSAEVAMLTLYPILLLFPFFLVTASLATHVGGRRAGFAAVAVTIFMYPTIWQFSAGRIDHHSLQIVLLMCALYCAVLAVKRPKYSFGAAVSLVAMMVIAMEALPFILAISLGVGMAWMINARKDMMLYFGGGLLCFSFPLLLLEKAGSDPFVVACDAYSSVFATAATTAGLGAIGLGLLTPRLSTVRARVFAATGAGLSAITLSALFYPDCLSAGPLSMIDDSARDFWFQYSPAVRGALQVLFTDRQYHLAYRYLTPIAAVIAGCILILKHRNQERLQLAILILAIVMGLLLSLWQLRMTPFAAALAIPLMAIMLGNIRGSLDSLAPRSILRAGLAGLFASPVPYIGGSFAAAAIKSELSPAILHEETAMNLSGICVSPGHVRALDALPRGVVMNQFNFGLGQRVLVLTEHSFTAAFYHRNANAALRSARFYDGAAETAACELTRQPVDYVLYCPVAKRLGAFDPSKPSLSELLFSGETPAWLEEIRVEGSGPLRVFKPNLPADTRNICKAE